MVKPTNYLPHFLCIGAQRAGTTWLYECLNEHPEVFVPEKKELHFFDRFYDQGIDNYLHNFPPEHLAHVKTWGELTPNYYQAPEALERIKDCIPDVKLIYILREPVSRAYSQYQLFSQSNYSGLSFSEVLETKPVVTDLSMQGHHLQRLLSLFKKEQILVLFYDDLTESPQALLKRVYSFLEVDSSFTPALLNKRVNRVVLPKTQAFLRKMRLGWLIEWIKGYSIAEVIKTLFHNKPKQQAKNPLFTNLAKNFENDITEIETMLDINLDRWRRH